MDAFDPSLLLPIAILGLAAGFLAGLLGIGGGMLLVPGLTFILGPRIGDPGLTVKVAIATSMATIVVTSVSSVLAHQRRGAIRWDIVARLAPGVVLGGLVGGIGLFAHLKGQWLALGFAAFVAWSGWRMLASGAAPARRGLPGTPGMAAVGTGIGTLSGLVGAGGGFLAVPFMVACSVPLHAAVATSAALGLPVTLSNVAGHAAAGWELRAAIPGAWGYFHGLALVGVALCSVPAAQLGARAAHALPARRLRRAFAVLLWALAAYMLVQGLRG